MPCVRLWWWAAVVLMVAQPVGLVLWSLLAYPAEFLILAPLELSGAVAALFLTARPLVGRSAARWKAEMRWFGRAAVRYLACCLSPVVLAVLAHALLPPREPTFEGHLWPLVAVAAWVTVPTLTLLLVQAPYAQRGACVGVLIALVPSAVPTLLVLHGYWQPLPLIAAQLLYAFVWMPGALTGPAYPRAGSRPSRLPARGSHG
ncbi:hypothetical protein ACWEQL_29945 [Kitasatospora sp. NPDC004240]